MCRTRIIYAMDVNDDEVKQVGENIPSEQTRRDPSLHSTRSSPCLFGARLRRSKESKLPI